MLCVCLPVPLPGHTGGFLGSCRVKLMTTSCCQAFSFSFCCCDLGGNHSTCTETRCRGAIHSPSDFVCLRNKLYLCYAGISGLLCNLENSYPILLPHQGLFAKGLKGMFRELRIQHRWPWWQTFKRSPHSETHLLLPPISLQLGENVIKRSAVIAGLGSRVRSPGF